MISNALQVPVDKLRIGMYVAELDRDWRDTPFLLQGFHIADDTDIDALRRHCRLVVIDPKHSTPGSFEHIARTETAPRRRDDAQGLLRRIKTRLGGFARAPDSAARERQALGLVPLDVTPIVYAEVKPIDTEMERAEQAYRTVDRTLEVVANQVANGGKVNVESLGSAVESMVESAIANPDALMWVARLRAEDSDTYAHGVKVAIYLLQLGRHLGFPPEQLGNLGVLGLLLDLGKIKVDRQLLARKGALTPAEFATVQRHVQHGLDALADSAAVHPDVHDGIAQHHERLDGSGYPYGLSGPRIGIHGRMAAIADSFAAMTSVRPHAAPQPAYDALKVLYAESGTHYHQPLVEQFVQAIGIFPAGSLVELSSGEVATVLAHNRVRRLEPRVLVLTDASKKSIREPRPLDLLLQPKAADGREIRIARGLPTGAYGLDLREFYFA